MQGWITVLSNRQARIATTGVLNLIKYTRILQQRFQLYPWRHHDLDGKNSIMILPRMDL